MTTIDKTSDAYGDHKYEEKKDGWITLSDERTKNCLHCKGATTSDRKHFLNRSDAVNHQYDIERGSSRAAVAESTCIGHKFENWWNDEGSAPPKLNIVDGGSITDDFETHCKKMCLIAWKNGAYCASR